MTNFGDPVSILNYSDVGVLSTSGQVAVDPTGALALVAKTGRLSACNPQTGALLWHLDDTPGTVITSGAFTSDGRTLAVVWGMLASLRIRVLDLTNQTDRYVVTASATTGPIVTAPVFSPDDALLAFHTGHAGGTLVVCPAQTGPPAGWTAPAPAPNLLPNFDGPRPMQFSPDATLVGFHDGSKIVLLQASTGRPNPVTVQTNWQSWTFTPDSRSVVSMAWPAGQFPSVHFTDISTGLNTAINLIFPTSPPPDLNTSRVLFSRAAQRVVVVSANSFAVFDLPTPPPETPESHPLITEPFDPTVSSPILRLSPGGRYLSVGQKMPNDAYRLRIIDLATNQTVWQRDGIGGMTSSFSSDGQYFAVWGFGTVAGQQWTAAELFSVGDPYQPPPDTGVGKLRCHTTFDTSITDATVTGASPPLAVAATTAPDAQSDPVVTLLDLDTGQPRRAVPIRGVITATACALDTTWVAVGSANGLLHCLHADPTGGDWQAKHGGMVNAIAVAATTPALIATASGDQHARLFTADPAPGENLADRQSAWLTVKHPQSVVRIAIGADGHWIVTGSADGNVRIFEHTSATGEQPALHTITSTSTSRVRAVTFGGTALAAASFNDGTVVLLDAATGTTVHSYDAHPAPVIAVRLNPDASLLATATAPPDAQVRLWSTAAGADTSTPVLTLDYQRPVNDLAFSPTKPILAVALAAASATLPTGAVAILHTDTGANTLRLPFETPVGRVGFSPDGALLVAASQHTLRVYATT